MDILKRLSSSFRKEAIVGLDIGEEYVTATRLSLTEGEGLFIEDIFWAEKPADASDKKIASIIKKLWHKHHVPTYTVISCLHTQSLSLKYFTYPDLSRDELKSALILEAEHVLQKPREKLCIDWHLYSKDTAEGVLVIAPQRDVDRHISILKMADLYPVALDIGCMAISNLFLEMKKEYSDKVTCLININGHNADIAILSGASFIYPRSLYMQTTSWQKRPDYLIENIKDMFRYHEFKLKQKQVENLVITGQPAFDGTFQAEIRKALPDLKVEFWNPLKDVKIDKKLTEAEINKYGPLTTVSLGLAIYKG